MRRTIISVLALVWFSGCVMIPDYQRPEAPVPKDLPSKEAGSGSAAAELPWREFIQDPELRQLIELALENNRDLRLAALNVEQVRALYKIQREELYPSIYAGGSGTRSGTSRDLLMPNQPRTTEVYHANLSLLAWELDFFGRLRSLSEKALPEYFATEQARSAAQILLISSVANGYLALAAERESLKLSEDTFKSQQEAYELVKRQFDQGDVAELEVRRAQIPCEVARGDIARYKQRVSAAENALQLLVGSPLPPELLPGFP